MKKNTIYKIAVAILLCLNCFLSYELITVHRNFQERSIQTIEKTANYSNRVKKFKDFIELQYELESFLPGNIITAKYSNWEGTRHMVVLFNENQCITCIQQIVLDFALIKQKTGFTNFVLMGCSFRNETDFFELVSQIDVEFSHKYLSDKNNILEEFEYPIVFFVDKMLNIKYIYSPDLLPEKRNWYFFTLITQYINMNV